MIAHDTKLAILAVAAGAPARPINKFNLLGRPGQPGELERHLSTQFDAYERSLAAKAFEELVCAGFLQPTLSDIAAPETWFVITESGRDALKRGALDSLDEALLRIDPHLLEIRRGAWAALGANRPDSLRQAAHSARELIEQVLKTAAPDEEVRAQSGFSPDRNSASGITRRNRLRLVMKKYRGDVSDSDLMIAEKASDLVLAIDVKLQGLSHSRSPPLDVDVRESLEIAEKMLRRLLVGES